MYVVLFLRLCAALNLLAFHCLAGDSVDGTFPKNLVFEVAEGSDSHQDAVISDAGSGDTALWKCCGITPT